MAATLELSEVGRRLPDSEEWLLRDITFAVSPSDRIAIRGPTGSGKTLLLRAMALLDPVDAGQIKWKGQASQGNRIPAHRRHIVYQHQRPALLDATVEENLRVPHQLSTYRHQQFDRDRAIGLLEALGRDASLLSTPHSALSGGEAQLVALIRTLQLNPEILLLDETTASLDPVATRAVEALLDQWLEEQPGTRAMIWVCHDPDQARRVARRVLTIRDGRVEAWEHA